MMSIGEMAKATGLSIKALRLYHDRELLVPAWVDAWTGYRYYDDASLERARLIQKLRGFDFSLAEIAQIVRHGTTEGMARYLERQRAAVRNKLHHYEALLSLLDDTLAQTRETLMAQKGFDFDRDVPTRLAAWRSRVAGSSADDRIRSFTVSSRAGEGGGTSLAAVLGQRCGFDVWDEGLIEALAADPHYDEVLAVLDAEQHAAANALLAPLLDARALDPAAQRQLQVTVALALPGRSVFLEMAAHHLFPKSWAVRVRLEPIGELLVEHYAKPRGLEADTARAELADKHAALVAASLTRFGRSLDAPQDYDLVLNSSTLDLYTAVDLAIELFESRYAPPSGWWSVAA